MTARYDEQQLREKLAHLDGAGLVVFTLSCAERMLPNYRRFVKEHGWGDESILRRALDLGWSWLENGAVDNHDARDLQAACFEQAPNTEDFASILVSSALDAANAAANVAGLLIEQDIEKAVEVASYGRDTVDMYVQELEDMTVNAPDLEERIRLHAMMQRELINQRKAIESITDGLSLKDAAEQWRSPKHGSIDLTGP